MVESNKFKRRKKELSVGVNMNISRISPISESRMNAPTTFNKCIENMDRDFSSKRQSRLYIKKENVEGLPTFVKLNSR